MANVKDMAVESKFDEYEADMQDLDDDTPYLVGAKYDPEINDEEGAEDEHEDDMRDEVEMRDAADVKFKDTLPGPSSGVSDEARILAYKKDVLGVLPRAPRSGKLRCGILGATGSVGQRFVDLLIRGRDSCFDLVAIGGSHRSVGHEYGDVVTWRQVNPLPEEMALMTMRRCKAKDFADCHLVFSALDAAVAEPIEREFAASNIAVFSNAKSNRMKSLVPLIVPTANPMMMALVQAQCEENGVEQGFIVCNPNCAVVGIVLPVVALQEAFGPISHISVVTMQAVSGAGFSPGVHSMDMIDNVIPFIDGEEEKFEPEIRKILGHYKLDAEGKQELVPSKSKISVTCNRVPVTDGHMACISVSFQNGKPTAGECKQALQDYSTISTRMSLSYSPQNAIELMDELDRPQPRLDRDRGNGFTVSVGRVRRDTSGMFDLMFTSLVHNTILGAAGASILNAEIAVTLGHLVPDDES